MSYSRYVFSTGHLDLENPRPLPSRVFLVTSLDFSGYVRTVYVPALDIPVGKYAPAGRSTSTTIASLAQPTTGPGLTNPTHPIPPFILPHRFLTHVLAAWVGKGELSIGAPANEDRRPTSCPDYPIRHSQWGKGSSNQ